MPTYTYTDICVCMYIYIYIYIYICVCVNKYMLPRPLSSLVVVHTELLASLALCGGGLLDRLLLVFELLDWGLRLGFKGATWAWDSSRVKVQCL